MEITLHVYGGCQCCMPSVVKALEGMEGVHRAEGDPISGLASIEFDSETITLEDIAQALGSLGFGIRPADA